MDEDEDIYDDEQRTEEVEDSEISPREEGFVKGYENDYNEGSSEVEKDPIDEAFE